MRVDRTVLFLLWLLSGFGQGLQAQDLRWTMDGDCFRQRVGHETKNCLNDHGKRFGYCRRAALVFPHTQYIRHLIISGRFYGKDSVLTIREDSASDAAAGFHVLYYRRTPGRRDMLEGHWATASGPQAAKPVDLAIQLEKKAPPFIPFALPKKKKDSAQLKALQGRETPVVATIPMRGSDTVRVELYDNGEIDGDSVSLYLNNDLLLQHYKLTADAKVLLVPIDKSLPVNRLVLFAENLGSIPPNTALMEVTVHGKTYELFLSTDYKRNACVEFELQE